MQTRIESEGIKVERDGQRPVGSQARTTVITGTLQLKRTASALAAVRKPLPRQETGPNRLAIMLALAHKIQQAIDSGKVADRAEVARRLGVTRARVTQIMNLTLLPVAEQERVLGLEPVDPLMFCQ